MQPKHINAYLQTAHIFAKCSTANRLKVGAICVKDDKIISIGYNGTPSGWSNVCEDENGKTIQEVIHAEANCITKLARTHESGINSTMFCTHSPCIECSKLIYASGITAVYYIHDYRSNAGIEFLQKVGVQVIKWKEGIN